MLKTKMATDIETTGCGIGRCRLQSLQCCATIFCFTVFYCFSSLTTSTLQIYISSQITTLERQFGFTSLQSGILLSCNDAGYLLVTLFVGYQATRTHIPRGLGVSTILFGLGGIVCSFAYFLMPGKDILSDVNNTSHFQQQMETSDLHLCNPTDNSTSYLDQQCQQEGAVVGSPTSFTLVAMFIIAFGMVLQGIGKSPRMPFVSYYIDENVEKRKTSIYLGVIVAIGIFGPALAFGSGAVFSNMYVTLKETDITPRDPRWIGAWWLGFLIFGVISIFPALPLFCFPKRYKPKDKDDMSKTRTLTLGQHVKGFLSTVLRLLKNGCFTFCLLGSCFQIFCVSGTVAFLPKYLETQFTILAWHANILIGGLSISAACIGSLLGGYIVYKLCMTPYACIKMTITVAIIVSCATILVMFIGCENSEIIGYNAQSSVNSTCVDDCHCDPKQYFPVCGSDSKNYFSYCHAGCTDRDKQVFTGCHCIGQNATALPGLCKTECDMLYVYVAVTFISTMIQTINIIPNYIFTMRCVHDKDKAMAVAVMSMLQTLLGWFPGPVIYGLIIDTCCRLWSESCGMTGACSLFDIVDFRYKKHGVDIAVRVLSSIMYFAAFLYARRRMDLRKQHKIDIDQKIKSPEGDILLNEIEKK